METKYQLPDFETFTLTEEESSNLKKVLKENEYRLDILEFHKANMIFLSYSWVQEKLKKRYENMENRNWAEFCI